MGLITWVKSKLTGTIIEGELIPTTTVLPDDCTTPRRKMEYWYSTQELLRDLHNKFVGWRETGLTKEQYDAFPQKIKDKYPYLNKISMRTWKAFHDEDFMLRSRTINEEIGKQREELKESRKWDIDVGEVERFDK